MMPVSRVQPVGEECFSSKCVNLKYVVGFRILIVFVYKHLPSLCTTLKSKALSGEFSISQAK